MTDLFRKIRDAFRSNEEKAAPQLTDAQIAALGRLRETPEWEIFTDILDANVNIVGEVLLAPQVDDGLLHFTRGRIAGLREAPLLVDKILAQEQHERSQADRKRSTDADRERVARKRSLYGTPGWAADSVRK